MIHRQPIIIFILIFATNFIFGQDTLLLFKKNNTEKSFKIPVNSYPIKIIPLKNKRFWAYITGYKDSVMYFKAKASLKTVRLETKKLYKKVFDSIQENNIPVVQQDSIFFRLQNREKQIVYSVDKKLEVSSIKKITLNNYFRPEKKKMMQTVDVMGYSALGGMLLVGPTLMIISPIFIPVFASFYFYSIAVIPVAIIAETKQLNLQRTWKIKVIEHNSH